MARSQKNGKGRLDKDDQQWEQAADEAEAGNLGQAILAAAADKGRDVLDFVTDHLGGGDDTSETAESNAHPPAQQEERAEESDANTQPLQSQPRGKGGKFVSRTSPPSDDSAKNSQSEEDGGAQAEAVEEAPEPTREPSVDPDLDAISGGSLTPRSPIRGQRRPPQPEARQRRDSPPPPRGEAPAPAEAAPAAENGGVRRRSSEPDPKEAIKQLTPRVWNLEQGQKELKEGVAEILTLLHSREAETAEVPPTGTEEPAREEPSGTTPVEATRPEPLAKTAKVEKRSRSSGRSTKIMPRETLADLHKVIEEKDARIKLLETTLSTRCGVKTPQGVVDEPTMEALTPDVSKMLPAEEARNLRDRNAELETQVATLTRERDDARRDNDASVARAESAENEVTRLNGLLSGSSIGSTPSSGLVDSLTRMYAQRAILDAISRQSKHSLISQLEELTDQLVPKILPEVRKEAQRLESEGTSGILAPQRALDSMYPTILAQADSVVREATPTTPPSPPPPPPPSANKPIWKRRRSDMQS